MPAQPSSISKQLDRIEDAIIGNGHEGLLARTARIEEKLTSIVKAQDDAAEEREEIKITALATASAVAVKAEETAEALSKKVEEEIKNSSNLINDLTMSLMKLGNLLEAHLKTDHLSEMIKKKSFWIVVIVILMAMNVIALYVPNIWDFIVKMLGIPKLTIPLQ
jgi:seryl-tRNA synthetase